MTAKNNGNFITGELLGAAAPARKLSKGEVLYRQGESATAFYYLKSGRVRVYMISPDGEPRTLSTASQGEILGEAAFFDRMPRISCAEALCDCEVTAIDEARLITLVRDNPRLALDLLKIQAARVRQLSSQLDAMTFMQADGRIAQLLLQNVRKENGELTVALTHEAISEAVGVSRVTVSKIVSRLSSQGVLRTAYRKLTVTDEKALRKLAGM